MREVKYRHTEIEIRMDPTSDLNDDVDAEDAPTCETCGVALTNHPNHRVITWVESGQVRSAHFCDEQCRMNWTRE
jgi:hypothetical protein